MGQDKASGGRSLGTSGDTKDMLKKFQLTNGPSLMDILSSREI